MSDEKDKNDGPLQFMDRLLEEERNSSLYVGDVRFWKHLEHIDSQQIYSTKSLEYKTLKMMFCEAVFFAIFLFLLTSYLMAERTGDLYSSRRQQLDYWGGCTIQGATRKCKIDEVKDVPTLMEWLRDDFSPKAFAEHDLYPSVVMSPSAFRLQKGTMPWKPRYVGDTRTSVLIGAIRMRQVRVQYSKDCTILPQFMSLVKDCFADYNDGIQSRLSWAPAFSPPHLSPHYKFQMANLTQQRPMAGKYATYPGDGFVLDLALNLTGAQTRFTELGHWQWVDERTRAFIIELNTMNPNVNGFVHTRILFEFPAAGGIHVYQDSFPFNALQLSLPLMASDDLGGSFLYFVATCGFCLLYSVYIGFLMYKNGLRFWTYFWSWMEVLIILVFVSLLVLKFSIFFEAEKLPNLKPEVISDLEMFYPIGALVPTLDKLNGVQALLGLISWLHVLKYLTLSVTFLPFVRVFERCFTTLLLFSILLIIVLLGFTFAIYIGYGTEKGVFSSIWSIFVLVAVAPAGGVNFEIIFAEYTDIAGPIIIIAYVIVIVLLVLTTFNAIQVDCYSVTTFLVQDLKRLKKAGTSGNPILIFLYTYMNALKGVKLVGKESTEDIGNPNEQVIALSSLPEVVVKKFLKTKKHMEAIRDNAKVELEEALARRRSEQMMGAAQQSAGSSWGSLRGKLDGTKMGNPQMALEDEASEDEEPPQADDASHDEIMVSRVQMQRMLEDDEELRGICSTHRAVDVFRRFRVDESGGDPFEAVASLQASVAKKLDDLEKLGSSLSFDEAETLRAMSTELHSTLTETQKEWRAELLSVLQMASLLSSALIDLTRKMEQLQSNHTDLAMRAAPLTLGNR
ncbi:unnamed protein product [Polarella glacialis]|uniref:Polycystin cation channel PKD1/PKD2 domain-containing protein n=1 Tax=Polarella glacialis TaxID=89957 RepID=A0A813G2N1_POLGL|nr:unnamed protein product [Polarella glacialis]|mmetsp:Transcript_26286/g.42111  ORF Transcript_26286/g.42111 Transcript_26286/m.42111 type:complete len:848 (-) Transcript_26286:72-2615(-)